MCIRDRVLMDSSEESPNGEGLKLFEGQAQYLPEGLKIPHMGWNKLNVVKECPILEGVDTVSYTHLDVYKRQV